MNKLGVEREYYMVFIAFLIDNEISYIFLIFLLYCVEIFCIFALYLRIAV